jgi:hypothetical protein
MAYFPHAYQKTFLALGAVNATGTTTASLNKGDFAVCNASTYTSLDDSSIAGVSQVIFAQGSLHDVDKLGPFHGGYQESVKSKGINPKYVSAAWKSVSSAEVAATLTVEAEGDCFACGAERYLRLDVKGSPALRFLGRNAYFVADWTEKCCVDGQSTVDPFVVLETWAKQIINDPLVTPFVTVGLEEWDTVNSVWVAVDYVVGVDPSSIYDPKATAVHTVTTQSHGKFRIVVTANLTSVVSTHFGDAGFRPTDHYELEPVQLFASEVDETGDACNVICTSIASTIGTQKTGTGESVIRQLILNNRYDQDPFQQDSRMREILNETAFNVDRTASYDLFYVLHSVPRKSNPSGTMDNDQYLLCVATEAGGPAVADVEALITALAVEAGVDNGGALYVK